MIALGPAVQDAPTAAPRGRNPATCFPPWLCGTYANQLRRKLQDDPTSPRLVTEPGVGYRLIAKE